MLNMAPARRNRILLWVALGLLVAGMLLSARRVLLPYVLGLIMAYILLPVVNWLDRHMPRRFRKWHIARALSIILVYVLLAGLVAGIMAFVVPLVADQIQNLIENWPSLSSRVEEWGTRGWGWYQRSIPANWRETIETNLKGLLDDVIRAVRDGVLATARTVFGTISFVIGMLVIPFWLFYMLHDESRVKAGIVHALPEQLQPDAVCMARLIDDVLSAYLRGQLLLCVFVGSMAALATFIIGVPFSPILGLLAGVFEILPYIGPILGAIPAVILALLSDPFSAIWVVVAFIAIQQIENLILVPRISGKSVRLHPALVMVVLVIGNETAGLWGMLLAVPLTAVIRDVFKYLYLRLMDEPLSPEKAMASVRSRQEVPMGV
jgi:predicted PurR-regulated permease PerM